MRSGEHQGQTFNQYLSIFLLTYRSTAHSTTNMSPSMLFLKQEVRTRLDLLRPDVKSRVAWKQAGQKKAHDEHCRERTLFIGQRVMAKNYRAGAGWLPGTVIERNRPLSYLIKVSRGQLLWRRHIDQLKEVDDIPSEHSSEQLQETHDETDWTLVRRLTQVDQTDSTGSPNQNVTQQSEGANQSSVSETQPQRYPLRKRTPNKKYL